MMRKTALLGVVLVMAGAVFADNKGKDVKLTGYVVDNACATAHAKDANVAETVKGHPKSCAMMEACAKSGYSVLADGKLYKLDEAGNKRVADLLKSSKSDKGLNVAVEGTLDGDTLHVKKAAEVQAGGR